MLHQVERVCQKQQRWQWFEKMAIALNGLGGQNVIPPDCVSYGRLECILPPKVNGDRASAPEASQQQQ